MINNRGDPSLSQAIICYVIVSCRLSILTLMLLIFPFLVNSITRKDFTMPTDVIFIIFLRTVLYYYNDGMQMFERQLQYYYNLSVHR